VLKVTARKGNLRRWGIQLKHSGGEANCPETGISSGRCWIWNYGYVL